MADNNETVQLIKLQKEEILDSFKRVKEITDNPVKIEFDYTIFDKPVETNPDEFEYDASEGILHDKKGQILQRIKELGIYDE